MENSEKEKCPQCREHCPVDDLQCGRGRAYFGVPDDHGDHDHGNHDHGEHGHGEHGHREHSYGDHDHGEHGHREHSYGDYDHRDHGHGDHGERANEGGHGKSERRDWHKGHDRWHEDLESGEISLTGLLSRGGYLAEKKSGKQRGQRKILQILTGHSQLSQRALQDKLGIESGSMSEIITKLEEKGLIRRERDEKDRRRLLISLTEEGEQVAEQNSRQEQGDEIFDVLSEEEKKRLKEILTKLLEQWKKQYVHYNQKADESNKKEN